MAAMNRATRLGDWTDESGAELIEFAVVFPLFLLVMLGIIDFGFLFHRYEIVTNAAREGARVSVLPGYSDADVGVRVNQYLDAAGLTDPARTTAVGAAEPLTIGTQCIAVKPVTVTYPHNFSFVAGIASYFGTEFTSSTLSATSSMRAELPATACP
jgi:Flp pilus assembly protein TadG